MSAPETDPGSGMNQADNEFVAAQARHDIRGARTALEDARDRA
jgi:hypothetical protein